MKTKSAYFWACEAGDDCQQQTCDGVHPSDKAQRPSCAGCGDGAATLTFCEVTHHDGSTVRVLYCGDCIALARMDWNGETAKVVPVVTR